jgi:hypothetical protein
MAFASERTCACLWDGAGCAQSDLLYGMSALSDDEIEVWYHLMARAGRAQLDGADTIPADPANLDTGMRAIMRAMSDQDRDRFIDVAEGRTRTMADRCFAARALFTGLEALEPPRQAPFTRALLSAGGAQ